MKKVTCIFAILGCYEETCIIPILQLALLATHQVRFTANIQNTYIPFANHVANDSHSRRHSASNVKPQLELEQHLRRSKFVASNGGPRQGLSRSPRAPALPCLHNSGAAIAQEKTTSTMIDHTYTSFITEGCCC